MKRTMIFVAIAVLVPLVGCTSASNKIADKAFDRGTETENSIVKDLMTMAMQSAVDTHSTAARAAAASGDEDAAAAAVTAMATEADKIFWLAYQQHERANEMHRTAHRYIWEQRGWASVLYEDLTQAKARVDARKADPDNR